MTSVYTQSLLLKSCLQLLSPTVKETIREHNSIPRKGCQTFMCTKEESSWQKRIYEKTRSGMRSMTTF